MPVPGLPPDEYQFRRSSYGLNNFLTSVVPPKIDFRRLERVPHPSGTVHFIFMAKEGEFAASDHPHVENWTPGNRAQFAPKIASGQLQTDAHGGPNADWESVTNYGFLDGHAETLKFSVVFTDLQDNKFIPTATP